MGGRFRHAVVEDRAVYSPDMKYRYLFQRRWSPTDDPEFDSVVWVLLNPGTGDTDGKPRQTLTRCIDRSRQWGFASLTIVNLFAYRSTKPVALRAVDDPVGPDNDAMLRRITREAPRVVIAWGGHGTLHGRSAEVLETLTNPMCLGCTAAGEPRHPLMVPAAARLRPYRRS